MQIISNYGLRTETERIQTENRQRLSDIYVQHEFFSSLQIKQIKIFREANRSNFISIKIIVLNSFIKDEDHT
jgi:hypothetical protein